MFTEQMSPFFIPIGEMDFFSLVLLFCALLLITVLFLFQKKQSILAAS